MHNHYDCPDPPYSHDLELAVFLPYPQMKITMKGKYCELMQDTNVATIAQVETQGKGFARFLGHEFLKAFFAIKIP